MTKVIKITTEQYNRYIFEGIDYKKQGTQYDAAPIDFSINQDKTDKGNIGKNSVDTRVFGNKQDILHGDGTTSKKTKTLYQQNNSKRSAIKFYQSIINYVTNGRQGEIYTDEYLDKATYTAVMKWFSNNYSDNRIIDGATKALNRIQTEAEPYFQKYDRVNNSDTDDKIARYNTGIVPSTNIKYIALFSMTDFNFSDAIKHGMLRQNGNTDEILGIDKSQRLGQGRSYDTIGITYDGKYQPNIAQNFSLNNVQNGHYKQQFGFNGNDGYSSVTQFIDKSILYASYALKQENYNPDFIIAAPSSSKFNDYYCQNLSHKIGKEYIRDFFQRNIVNVKFDDGRDISDMKKRGFSDKDIIEFSTQVKGVAYTEIAHIISQPLRNFIYDNQNYFGNISKVKNSREKANIDDVFDCTMTYAYNTIIENILSNEMDNYLVKNFMNKSLFLQKPYDSQHLIKQVFSIIKMKIGIKVFNQILLQIQNLTQQYVTQLQERGYKLRFNTKRFKITQFKKQFRPFLHNVYIVADTNLNNNGELFKRYKNGKFLIFDEDINSGATLKCAIDALQEKLPNANNQNILCLVNAYSASGY